MLLSAPKVGPFGSRLESMPRLPFTCVSMHTMVIIGASLSFYGFDYVVIGAIVL